MRSKKGDVVIRLILSSVLLVGFGLSAANAQSGKLTVELNKFEDAGEQSCRAFFLFRNETELTLEEFEMSMAILNTGGIIDRLLTIDAAPLPAERTTLKLFEIPETSCGSISEILVHEIGRCKPQNADPIDCFGVINLVSRTKAALVN